MFHHISVMLNETIDYLNVKENGVYIDCTLGGAGHALYLLNQLNDDGRLIAIDQDQTAIDNAKEVLKDHLHKVTFVHSNFRELTQILITTWVFQAHNSTFQNEDSVITMTQH